MNSMRPDSSNYQFHSTGPNQAETKFMETKHSAFGRKQFIISKDTKNETFTITKIRQNALQRLLSPVVKVLTFGLIKHLATKKVIAKNLTLEKLQSFSGNSMGKIRDYIQSPTSPFPVMNPSRNTHVDLNAFNVEVREGEGPIEKSPLPGEGNKIIAESPEGESLFFLEKLDDDSDDDNVEVKNVREEVRNEDRANMDGPIINRDTNDSQVAQKKKLLTEVSTKVEQEKNSIQELKKDLEELKTFSKFERFHAALDEELDNLNKLTQEFPSSNETLKISPELDSTQIQNYEKYVDEKYAMKSVKTRDRLEIAFATETYRALNKEIEETKSYIQTLREPKDRTPPQISLASALEKTLENFQKKLSKMGEEYSEKSDLGNLASSIRGKLEELQQHVKNQNERKVLIDFMTQLKHVNANSSDAQKIKNLFIVETQNYVTKQKSILREALKKLETAQPDNHPIDKNLYESFAKTVPLNELNRFLETTIPITSGMLIKSTNKVDLTSLSRKQMIDYRKDVEASLKKIGEQIRDGEKTLKSVSKAKINLENAKIGAREALESLKEREDSGPLVDAIEELLDLQEPEAPKEFNEIQVYTRAMGALTGKLQAAIEASEQDTFTLDHLIKLEALAPEQAQQLRQKFIDHGQGKIKEFAQNYERYLTLFRDTPLLSPENKEMILKNLNQQREHLNELKENLTVSLFGFFSKTEKLEDLSGKQLSTWQGAIENQIAKCRNALKGAHIPQYLKSAKNYQDALNQAKDFQERLVAAGKWGDAPQMFEEYQKIEARQVELKNSNPQSLQGYTKLLNELTTELNDLIQKYSSA